MEGQQQELQGAEARMGQEKLSQYKKYFSYQNSIDQELLSVLNVIKEYSQIALSIVEGSTLAEKGTQHLLLMQEKAKEEKEATEEQSNKKNFMWMISNRHEKNKDAITKKYYSTLVPKPETYKKNLAEKTARLVNLYYNIHADTPPNKEEAMKIQKTSIEECIKNGATTTIRLHFPDHSIAPELKVIHTNLLQNILKIDELLQNYTKLHAQYMNQKNPAAPSVATPTCTPQATEAGVEAEARTTTLPAQYRTLESTEAASAETSIRTPQAETGVAEAEAEAQAQAATVAPHPPTHPHSEDAAVAAQTKGDTTRLYDEETNTAIPALLYDEETNTAIPALLFSTEEEKQKKKTLHPHPHPHAHPHLQQGNNLDSKAV